ncbi:MAG: alanine--glyoxylate aminotransferase family protein [Sulfolobales archaeon]
MVGVMKVFTDRFILTPGPTEIPYRVRVSLLRETSNPDLDPEFLNTYNKTRDLLKELIGGRSSSLYILSGEAILGLEAAIANTIRKGDKVVVISNGVYGEGFADFVKSYGGIPISVGGSDWRRSINIHELDTVLQKNKDVVAVTLVHCDTPSALLNDISEISKVVRGYDSLLIVDAVSSIGGTPINFDLNGLDIVIGGSQKVLNTPPGLTIIAVSRRAWERMDEVKYSGYYLNLRLWRDMLDGQGVFPHTMSDVLIYALNESLKMIFEEGLENVYKRHELVRDASWRSLEVLKLEPYPSEKRFSSPTVTAFLIPAGIDERELRDRLWIKYGVMVAGSWGKLQGKVIRVGHMGVQASRTHLLIAYTALGKALGELGHPVNIGDLTVSIEEFF